MRYRLQRHDGTDCSATMVPITVLRMVPIQRYRHDVDPLWSKIADGYTKQFCFREYSMEQINAGGELGRQNAKKWFNSQLEYWGRNGCKVLNPFLSSISEEAQEFRTNFDNMIKQYIHD